MKEILKAIDEVIEKAKTLANETGPDPDYRRYAQKELDEARDKLIALIKKEIK